MLGCRPCDEEDSVEVDPCTRWYWKLVEAVQGRLLMDKPLVDGWLIWNWAGVRFGRRIESWLNSGIITFFGRTGTLVTIAGSHWLFKVNSSADLHTDIKHLLIGRPHSTLP